MKPANMFAPFLVVLGLLCPFIVSAPIANAQTETAISTDGVIESTEGGFKFPDGTVQTTRSTDVAAFEYVLETDSGGFAISRDLRPELDEFCGDYDGCSIRLATAFRQTTVSTGEVTENNGYIEKFEFMIGPTFERSGGLQTDYSVEGTEIQIHPDYLQSSAFGRDGNGEVRQLSNHLFGHCIFSDIDPNATGFSNLPDQSIGMTLHAFGEDYGGATDFITDLVCRMWIFD